MSFVSQVADAVLFLDPRLVVSQGLDIDDRCLYLCIYVSVNFRSAEYHHFAAMTTQCEALALKKCLEENNGNSQLCKKELQAFQKTCGISRVGGSPSPAAGAESSAVQERLEHNVQQSSANRKTER